jgi:GNAT superfamily N-acetyltransferase
MLLDMKDIRPYSLRIATPADAEVIARHRALMFRDMGAVTQEESIQIFDASISWLERLLTAEEYVAWLVQLGDDPVAGAGIHLREAGPVPGCHRIGRWGHMMNVYTAEAHRRRGLARLLVQEILQWSAQNHLDQLTLAASESGRSLYRSLGFIPTEDMRLPRRLLGSMREGNADPSTVQSA